MFDLILVLRKGHQKWKGKIFQPKRLGSFTSHNRLLSRRHIRHPYFAHTQGTDGKFECAHETTPVLTRHKEWKMRQ